MPPLKNENNLAFVITRINHKKDNLEEYFCRFRNIIEKNGDEMTWNIEEWSDDIDDAEMFSSSNLQTASGFYDAIDKDPDSFTYSLELVDHNGIPVKIFREFGNNGVI